MDLSRPLGNSFRQDITFHLLSIADMPTILITGASNGLGATFVQAYATQPDTKILAIDIQASSYQQPNVHSYTVDISSAESISTFASSLDQDLPIDLLIHSAGIRGLVPQVESSNPNNVAAAETLRVMDSETLLRTFQINAAGTFLLIQALLPHLLLAREAKVVLMSSRMGSVSNNEHPNKAAGGAYAYRASKAALNIVVRSFAADVPEVVFVLCHPGRVETKLVKCVEEGAIPAEESVDLMMPLIAKWGRDDSGRFYDRFGEVLPW